MVSRRTVLKAMAASVVVPTIQLRPTVPDEKLLMSFCDPDAFRWDFTKPFGVGSLTYATDSRAMVRCELGSRVEDGERRLPPNVLDVWNYWWRPAGHWRPLMPEDLVPTENVNGSCPHCGNRRVSFGDKYPDDQVSADALPDWDPDDNTIRDVSCEACRGRHYEGPSCVRIGGVLHSSWNLRRVLALPNPQICAGVVGLLGDPSGAVLFRADGFEGISLGFDEG